jgi:TetR/AcrR family fatty acid metabolism transcriptional regulator
MEAQDTREKNDKYHRILKAAAKLFAQQGFRQSTVAQVAKEAGVADGTIYLYFKSKEDLLVHHFSTKTHQVFERFRQAVDRAENSIEKLRNLIRVHLAEFQNDPDMAIIYQVETRRINRLAEEQIRAMAKMYMDIIAEIVEQGQQEGTIRRDLYLGLVKRFILGAVDEVIGAWLHSGRTYDLATMADPLVALFINGIGAKKDSQTSV